LTRRGPEAGFETLFTKYFEIGRGCCKSFANHSAGNARKNHARRPDVPVAPAPSAAPTQRTTRALPPCMSFSTSFCVAIEVSPGVVAANAPCAAP
jgi:hypothetical protein